MEMNREFLENLYGERDFAAERLNRLQQVNTFCAEQCATCERSINSNEAEHRAALAEAQNASTTLDSLLDMYWRTHNG